MDSSILLIGVIIFLSMFLVFMICRSLTLWYFRINEIVSVLKEIRDGKRVD